MMFTCCLKTTPSKNQYRLLHTEIILVHAEICRTESKVLGGVCVCVYVLAVRVALRISTREDGL